MLARPGAVAVRKPQTSGTRARAGTKIDLRDQLREIDVPDDEMIWQPLRDLLAGYGLRNRPAAAPCA
jgi:hypothetical protein